MRTHLTHLTRLTVLFVALATLMAGLAGTAEARGARDSFATPDRTEPTFSHEVEACYVDGFRVCFDEEIEIAVPCNTTNLKAGQTCPHPFENARPTQGFIAKAPPGGSADGGPFGSCIGAAACNDLIAECIGNGGDFDADEHDGEGQPTVGHCTD